MVAGESRGTSPIVKYGVPASMSGRGPCKECGTSAIDQIAIIDPSIRWLERNPYFIGLPLQRGDIRRQLCGAGAQEHRDLVRVDSLYRCERLDAVVLFSAQHQFHPEGVTPLDSQ
ncbi:hypothetical protein MMAS_09410 [Mycobacteroides abscessus subsp. massiliense CCUG 48898 = JCM 15300]|nr:hypothetical protein MMAS_09410 [Mycobacteroides abscessus subsp. massiliense CCUG 48898 = JCM 15300]